MGRKQAIVDPALATEHRIRKTWLIAAAEVTSKRESVWVCVWGVGCGGRLYIFISVDGCEQSLLFVCVLYGFPMNHM